MLFYRVGHKNTKEGLWYNASGEFIGRIHNLKFCKNTELKMPYDERIKNYLSATESLEDLYNWFTKEDIKKLRQYGYQILVYESDDYFKYNNHYVFNKNSKLVRCM